MPRLRPRRTTPGLRSLLLSGLLVLLVPLNACGSSTTKPFVIAVLPSDCNGSLPDEDQSVWQAVKLAVTMASLPNNHTLQYTCLPDAPNQATGPDPATGATNIRTLLRNTEVMAAVGPTHSMVAQNYLPNGGATFLPGEVATLQDATNPFALISPAATKPCLTLATVDGAATPSPCDYNMLHPAGKPNAFFRVVTNDSVEGLAVAQLASQRKYLRVYVVGLLAPAPSGVPVDYGTVLAHAFTTQFATQAAQTKSGAVIVSPQGQTDVIDPTKTDPPTLATKILATNPDLVFYGGSGMYGAPLKMALHNQCQQQPGCNEPAMEVGDAIADNPKWLMPPQLGGAGAVAGNTFGLQYGRNPNPAWNDQFITAFKAKYPGAVLSPFGVMAYDAAMIEIIAITDLINQHIAVTRATVLEEVSARKTPFGPKGYPSESESAYGGTIQFLKSQNAAGDAGAGDNAGPSWPFDVWDVEPGASSWSGPAVGPQDIKYP